MKKLLIALAAAFVLGTTSTGFAEEEPAAENPPAKISDAVKLSGKFEYTSTHSTTAVGGLKEKTNSDEYVFQLDALAKINENWTANARIEAKGDLDNDDDTLDAKLPRVWVEGDYGSFNFRLGKMELLTNEGGLVWDTDFTGAHMTFGNALKFSGMGGRISSKDLDDGIMDESATQSRHVKFVGVNLQYEKYPGFGGAGYYLVMGDGLKTTNYLNSIWSANLGYIFSEKFVFTSSFAQNVMTGNEKYSWQAAAVYGNYGDYPERGDWNVMAAYRQYGNGVSFAPTKKGALESSRGWLIGVAYAPLKNIGVELNFFKGKDLESGVNVKNIWARAEFFF